MKLKDPLNDLEFKTNIENGEQDTKVIVLVVRSKINNDLQHSFSFKMLNEDFENYGKFVLALIMALTQEAIRNLGFKRFYLDKMDVCQENKELIQSFIDCLLTDEKQPLIKKVEKPLEKKPSVISSMIKKATKKK